MITRVYFLSAEQAKVDGGICHAFRTVRYKSWFPVNHTKIINNFFDDISMKNDLPNDRWILNSFSRVQ